MTNPQIENCKKQPQTQTVQTTDATKKKKNPLHMYLRLLTPLTPSVEKIVYLHGVQVILCFVDRASLYNLVNKANLVHNFS